MEKTDNITESGKDLKEAEGVDFKGIVDGKAVIELQSGTYQFDMEREAPTVWKKVRPQTYAYIPTPSVTGSIFLAAKTSATPVSRLATGKSCIASTVVGTSTRLLGHPASTW